MVLSFLRKSFAAILFFLPATCVFAQELNQVTFTGGEKLSYFSLLTDRDVLIRISEKGKIIEWGKEERSFRNNNYYAPRLQPYLGRIEYYGPEADSVFRGKIKSIGSALITYYGAYETELKIGKIKSVGTVFFDYYNNYDLKEIQGKIKFIGNLELGYYSSFENESYRGNLKSIGSTMITYYSSFDDRMIRGKIKTIGPVSFIWYTSLDRAGYAGSLKSGVYRQNIGSIIFILQ